MKFLMRRFALAALLPVAMCADARPEVRTEHLQVASPAWAFQQVARPSRSDAAQGARVALVGNTADPAGAGPEALTDGQLRFFGLCAILMGLAGLWLMA